MYVIFYSLPLDTTVQSTDETTTSLHTTENLVHYASTVIYSTTLISTLMTSVTSKNPITIELSSELPTTFELSPATASDPQILTSLAEEQGTSTVNAIITTPLGKTTQPSLEVSKETNNNEIIVSPESIVTTVVLDESPIPAAESTFHVSGKSEDLSDISMKTIMESSTEENTMPSGEKAKFQITMTPTKAIDKKDYELVSESSIVQNYDKSERASTQGVTANTNPITKQAITYGSQEAIGQQTNDFYFNTAMYEEQESTTTTEISTSRPFPQIKIYRLDKPNRELLNIPTSVLIDHDVTTCTDPHNLHAIYFSPIVLEVSRVHFQNVKVSVISRDHLCLKEEQHAAFAAVATGSQVTIDTL